MQETTVIIPCPRSGDDFVELARTREVRGRLFKKHILNLGTLIHPKTGERLELDEPWFDTLRHNFKDGVCDIVQVPLADAQNKHSEDPDRNIGEVIDITREGKKVYAHIDARDPVRADQLGRTLLGASAMLNLDYTDTRTGRKVGPTLLHTCITNRPYVTGLDDYQEVLAATADGEEDVVVLASEETGMPTKEELLAQLKDEHGIDVAALEAKAAQADPAALTAALSAALAKAGGNVKLSSGDDEITLSDVVGAVAELAADSKAKGDKIDTLMLANAEAEVDGYVRQGRVLPKQRNAYIKLALGDREQLEEMLPVEPVVKLNNQDGSEGTPQGEGAHTQDLDAELARLTGAHAQFFSPDTSKKNGR